MWIALCAKSLKDFCIETHVRKWKNAKGEIENHIRPAIGDVQLLKVTKADIRKLIEGVEGGVAKNRVLARARAFFNWAIGEDFINFNPSIGITKPTVEKPISRILSEEEIRATWNAGELVGEPGRKFIKLLILSGQRRDDVRCFHYSEIRGDDWIIPAERYKGGREHLVPLTDAMKEIIGSGNGYVISASGGEKAYDGLSKLKKRVDKACQIEAWTWHDLRRTVRTGLSRLGVRADVAERVIGHSVGGSLGRVYDLYSYRDEKLEALKMWNDYVLSLVGANQFHQYE